MTELHLFDFKQEQTDEGGTLSCRVQGEGIDDQLTYQITTSDRAFQAPKTADWAVVGLLYPAMMRGANLRIEAGISRDLLFSLREDMQVLLRTWRGSLHKIDIVADAVDFTQAASSKRVATGFSGGIDTFATLAIYSGDEAPYAITDLTLFDVGAFGKHKSEAQNEVIARSKSRLKDYALSTGRHWFCVDTNLNDFYVGLRQAGFQRTHPLRNASAALALRSSIDVYNYSSSHTYYEVKTHDAIDIGRMDPITLPLLSSEGLKFISSGASKSRFEKTALVSTFEESFDLLDVCSASAEKRLEHVNCSVCEKCLRTLVTLDLLGKVDHYRASFDLDLYYAHREDAVRKILILAMYGSPSNRELRDHIRGTDLDGKLTYRDRMTVMTLQLKDRLKNIQLKT